MEQTIAAIVSKLDANSLFFAIILFGIWKLSSKAMAIFDKHGDKVSTAVERIAEDAHELRQDMSRIASTVAVHDVRISSLERNEK